MSTTIETIMNSKGAMLALAIIAFLMAAALVLVIVRMLFGGRLRMPGGRARQARLGIVDAFDLDRQRQLIIVRRDNTEHLIMIGGPNDLLIESEIVRVEARDLRRDKAPDFMAAPGDGRIPAPFAQPSDRSDAPDLGPAAPDFLPFTENAPLLPEIPQADPASGAPVAASTGNATPRAPTFPLPPRRPSPLPERRPMPPTRQEETRSDPTVRPSLPSLPVQMPADQMPAFQPPPAFQLPAAQGPSIQIPSDPPTTGPAAIDLGAPAGLPTMPLVAPAPATATPRTVTPSFLKPLPPRPPLRPLARTNPKPPKTPADGLVPPPVTPALDPAVDTPRPPLVEPSPAPKPSFVMPPAPLTPPTPAPHEEPKDALESLEEEMAKLLGRGPTA